MKVPKYRAWDVHKKKMFTNNQLIVWNGNIYANDSSKLNVDNLKGWSIDEKYLMQFTGLKDKNGKEVFEGDIVRFFDDYGDFVEAYTTPVVFIDWLGAYGVEWNGLKSTFEEINEYYNEVKYIEVLGNIYENPELLEK